MKFVSKFFHGICNDLNGLPMKQAPEILECREYDAKADIWSVGCVFYEMLVGTSKAC